eukprot:Pgem_evm1s7768
MVNENTTQATPSKWKSLLLTDKSKNYPKITKNWIIRMQANVNKNNLKQCLIIPNANAEDPKGETMKDWLWGNLSNNINDDMVFL